MYLFLYNKEKIKINEDRSICKIKLNPVARLDSKLNFSRQIY